MNFNLKLLFFYLVFILLYIFYSSYMKRKESIENIHIHIGNYLSVYFFRMGISILKQEDFYFELDDTNFIKYLPKNITYNDNEDFKNLYNCFNEKGITYENMKNTLYYAEWYIRNNNQMQFWMCMKPLINKLLDNAFIETGLTERVDCPIIHFRCSDVPFQRHPSYHIDRYEFYKKALERINEKLDIQYKKVKILYNNYHLSDDKKRIMCDVYCNQLKNYLNKIGYEVEIYSNSDIDDFSNLFYAPAVISGVSSYSFMSGFFGNGIFITSEHLEEQEAKLDCNLCDEWMFKGYQIKHNTVHDYFDITELIPLLERSS